MLILKRTVSSSKGLVPYLKKQNQIVYPLKHQTMFENSNAEGPPYQRVCFQGDIQRLLHTTSVKRDLEAGLRALGAGIAATGVIGSGIGLGIIFGNLASSVARNPSVAGKVFTNSVMGAAFCESLGLFALVIAFVIM